MIKYSFQEGHKLRIWMEREKNMLEIQSLTLGPVQTNSYLVADPGQNVAVVVDPAWHGTHIADKAREHGWKIEAIWLTHAHFDHLGGVAGVIDGVQEEEDRALRVGLHPRDKPLWERKGGAPSFGMDIDPGPEPDLLFEHGQKLTLGSCEFEVRYAPGHTPGHVMFYCQDEALLFSGDVIFRSGIGRTDLPGGDYETLIQSIQTQVLPLPDRTRVFSGHGPSTTVGRERERNPFIQ